MQNKMKKEGEGKMKAINTKQYRVTGTAMDYGKFSDEMTARATAERVNGVAWRLTIATNGKSHIWQPLTK